MLPCLGIDGCHGNHACNNIYTGPHKSWIVAVFVDMRWIHRRTSLCVSRVTQADHQQCLRCTKLYHVTFTLVHPGLLLRSQLEAFWRLHDWRNGRTGRSEHTRCLESVMRQGGVVQQGGDKRRCLRRSARAVSNNSRRKRSQLSTHAACCTPHQERLQAARPQSRCAPQERSKRGYRYVYITSIA